MHSLDALAWRSMVSHRSRTTLSALAVALGVMMTVAADVVGAAVTSFGQRMEGRQSTAGILGGQLELWLGVIGWVILGVAAFLVFNAFAMSVTQQRRQIGLLRVLGMTRRQVMRIVLNEALLVGVAGTALGLLCGPLLGRGIVILLAKLADIAHGKSIPSLSSMLLASALGIGITALSMFFPARRATRISPLAALRRQTEHRVGTKRATQLSWIGVAVAVALAVCLAAAPPAKWMPRSGTARIPWPGLLLALCTLLWLASLGLILPVVVQRLGQWMRAPLSRLWGTAGCLVADNLRRDQGRVTLTVLALATSVMMIVTITGALALLSQSMLSYYTSKQIPPRWGVFSGSISGDLASWQLVSELDLSVFGFSDELTGEVVDAMGTWAEILPLRAAIVPELDVVPGSMSFLLPPQQMQRMAMFDFYEGDWESALPLLERGCGVLITPGLARRHRVGLYDTITVPGKDGPVWCTIAGLGLSANFGASLISDVAAEQFDVPERPFALFLQPFPGVDVAAFEADLRTFVAGHSDMYLIDLREADDFMETMVDGMLAILNGPLLLAIAVAALGVINTTTMSVVERRRELGLLRAVGATRRQVRSVVTGEAALMGLIGGLMGLLAGTGLAAIQVLSGDHSAWGLQDLALGSLLAHVLRASVRNGLVGTVLVPFVCTAAAWIPARTILRGTTAAAVGAGQIPVDRARRSHPDSRGTHRSLRLLAWRTLGRYRARTALCAAAVALGVATTVGSDVVSGGILNAISNSADAQTLMAGLLDQLDNMLTLIGVGVTLAAGFLVANAFAMSITQRRRQMGVLRSLGMTRRQVMRTVLIEASITGGMGTLAGLIAGPFLGRGTIALIRMSLGDVFVFETRGPSPAGLALAIALGTGVTLLSVLVPARRATRIPPLVALQQPGPANATGHPSLLHWVGLSVIAVMAAYLALSPPGEWIAAPWDTVLTIALALLWLTSLGALTPSLIGSVGRWIRTPISTIWRGAGRLIADNLRRERDRVTLTVLTLSVALALIVGLTGFIRFMYDELLLPKILGTTQLGAWLITEADFVSGMGGYIHVEDLSLSPQVIEAVERSLDGSAHTMPWRFTIVPELSFWGSSYFSFLIDPHALRQAGDTFFTFVEGSWESALPAMEDGCGVLVAPTIASRNGVSLGDALEVTGRDGPVICVVAGIGSPYVGASIIGSAAQAAFDALEPIALLVWPVRGVDPREVQADLRALLGAFPEVGMHELEDMAEMQTEVIDMLPNLFNALLLLAMVAAALGVVNTTLISVAERRREIGLYRAVGATRRQTRTVIVGEAALMGLIAGVLGLIAGTGVVIIVAVTYGGNSWGMPDLALWPAAWRSVRYALTNGLVGLLAAPPICAAAAWISTRACLRGAVVDTMKSDQ